MGKPVQPDDDYEDNRRQFIPLAELDGASRLDGAADSGGVDHVRALFGDVSTTVVAKSSSI